MPRTSTVDCPGCPPIRALTTDELGLIKVVESRGKPVGVPKVVERWGSPEASRHVLLSSMADHKHNPIMAIGRKNGLIELLSPLNGEAFTSDRVTDAFPENSLESGSSLAALHLFKNRLYESGVTTLLLCTGKGKACLRSLEITYGSYAPANTHTLKAWEVCSSGGVLSSSVNDLENYAIFAGKGIEINLWDLETYNKTWTSKSPRANNLGIFTPTWFTASTFLCKEDHRKLVAGTNFNQVRVYDISAQRRPVLAVDFRDSSIRAIASDPDEHKIYLGNARGELASLDMRTGKLLGCFLGKCSGSIRSIARHPEFPVIASCGLDGYLRIWDTKSRQLLSAVFLKQILTSVVLDTNFDDEASAQDSIPIANAPTAAIDSEAEDDEEFTGSEPPAKKAKKAKRKKKRETAVETSDTVDDEMLALRPQSPSQEKERHRRTKHKNRRKRLAEE